MSLYLAINKLNVSIPLYLEKYGKTTSAGLK